MPRRTRLDLILDSVTPQHEVTIDADGYTPEQVDRIYAAAKARGLHASGTRRWVLIRDMKPGRGRTRFGNWWGGSRGGSFRVYINGRAPYVMQAGSLSEASAAAEQRARSLGVMGYRVVPA